MSQQNGITTPLDEAEYEVKRSVLSFVEALVLANTIGLNESRENSSVYLGPDISYALLAATNIPNVSGSYLHGIGELTK
jgi:hypothetical protein